MVRYGTVSINTVPSTMGDVRSFLRSRFFYCVPIAFTAESTGKELVFIGGSQAARITGATCCSSNPVDQSMPCLLYLLYAPLSLHIYYLFSHLHSYYIIDYLITRLELY